MTENFDTRKLFELYDMMEEKLEELGIGFDEFTVLYTAFRGPSVKKEEEPKENSNPFPWLQAAGQGFS